MLSCLSLENAESGSKKLGIGRDFTIWYSWGSPSENCWWIQLEIGKNKINETCNGNQHRVEMSLEELTWPGDNSSSYRISTYQKSDEIQQDFKIAFQFENITDSKSMVKRIAFILSTANNSFCGESGINDNYYDGEYVEVFSNLSVGTRSDH